MRKNTWIFPAGLFFFFAVVTFSGQYFLYTGRIAPVSNFSLAQSVPAEMSSVYVPGADMGLKLSDDKIRILINGRSAPYTPHGESRVYKVYDGDVVHADMRECAGYGVVYVSSSSGEMLVPGRYSKYVAQGGTEYLFTVKIADLSQKR